MLLTLALTWPVAARLSSHVPFYNDTWIFLWDIHHVREALLDPTLSVFETRQVFHPEGISLAFHTLAPLWGLVALPFEPLIGLVATHNLFFLATFFASALTMRALAYKLTASPGASFLAGALFAFSPFHLAHSSHLNLLTIAFLPLTALSLLNLLERAAARDAVLLAVSAVLSFYACLEYALCSALLALTLLAHGLVRRRRNEGIVKAPLPRLAWRVLVSAAIATLLAAPGLVPLAAEAAVERHYDDPVDVQFSADLFSWITPSVLHSLWGGYTMKVYQHFPGVLAEWTTFIGVTVAILCLIAARARRRLPVGPWIAVAVVFGILAMGPSFRILGRPLPIPLPYRLLDSIPLLSAMREPSRFTAVVTLASSVLAAFGYRELRASRFARLASAALPLALLEFVQVPLATSPARAPAFLAMLAADPGTYAVLDVPADLALREHLYHQTIHGKSILLGYIARIPAASRRQIESQPLLADPAGWDLSRRRPGESETGERYVRFARSLGIRYALVHEAFYRRRGSPERFEQALSNLSSLPGARLAAREDGFAAVRIDGR